MQELYLTIGGSKDWKPPTEPIDPSWKPPSEPIAAKEPDDESRSIWQMISEPPPIVGKTTSHLAEDITTPRLGESKTSAIMKGFMAGGLEGAGNLLSPMNIMQTFLPESRISRILAGGQMTAGIKKMLSGDISGIGDVGFGALGLRGLGSKPSLPKLTEKKPDIPLENLSPLSSDRANLPPDLSTSETSYNSRFPPSPNAGESPEQLFKLALDKAVAGNKAQPMQTRLSLNLSKAELPSAAKKIITPADVDFSGDRTTGHFIEGVGGLSDAAAGKIARHEMPGVKKPFNISAKKPVATFKGWQPTGDPDNPVMALYDIHGGVNDKSTVTEIGLKKYGIDTPTTPEYKPGDEASGKKPQSHKRQDWKSEIGAVGDLKSEMHPTARHWQDQVNYLDNKNAPDSAYKEILSTGQSIPLKRGETWRNRVLGYIESRNKGFAPPTEPQEIRDNEVPFRKRLKSEKGELIIHGKDTVDTETGEVVPPNSTGNISGPPNNVKPQLLPLNDPNSGDPVNNIFRDKKHKISDILNLPKAIKASYDLSAPLRQGVGLADRPEYWKAFANMIKSHGSEAAYKISQDKIMSNPEYNLGKTAGLAVTDLHGQLSNREEAFMSPLAEKIPGVKWSERAYTQFLDELRQDTFSSLIKRARDAGLKPNNDMVLTKQIADYINNATGRGSLGSLEKNAVELNNLFFSPRFIASRVKMLNPNQYIRIGEGFSSKQAAFMRKQYLRSLFAIASAGTITAGLSKAAGGTVSFDPASADFLKSKIGNTRLDPFAGEQQYIVAAARLLMNKTDSSTSGRSRQLGKYNTPSSLGLVFGLGGSDKSMMESKFSPVASFVDDMLSAPKRKGFDVPTRVADLFTPMMIQDIYDLAKEDPDLIPLGVLSGLGMGVQTYGGRSKQTNPIVDFTKSVLGSR